MDLFQGEISTSSVLAQLGKYDGLQVPPIDERMRVQVVYKPGGSYGGVGYEYDRLVN